MPKTQLFTKYSRMNSKVLLNVCSKGGFSKKEAAVIAAILDNRFPKPEAKGKKSKTLVA